MYLVYYNICGMLDEDADRLALKIGGNCLSSLRSINAYDLRFERSI